jgi:hypothetical protein
MPHAGSRALSAAKMLGENNAQIWRNHSKQWFSQSDRANIARKGHTNYNGGVQTKWQTKGQHQKR